MTVVCILPSSACCLGKALITHTQPISCLTVSALSTGNVCLQKVVHHSGLLELGMKCRLLIFLYVWETTLTSSVILCVLLHAIV
jgi:hypothetical protein